MFEIYERLDYKKILSLIIRDWDKLKLPPVNQKNLNFQVLPFKKAGRHSLMNFMITSDDRPALVVRLPRYKSGRCACEALEHETKVLAHLQKKGLLKDRVPRIIKLLHIDHVPVQLVTAYNGQTINHELDREESPARLKSILAGGAELLLGLYDKKDSSRAVVDETFLTEQVRAPLQAVAEFYPRQIPAIEKKVNDFLRAGRFQGLKYPAVCQHQEFNPWNIFRTREGQLIVLDWEDAEFRGLPLLDLYNFFEISYRILFIGESKAARERGNKKKQERNELLLTTYAAFSDKYCRALNLDQELKDLFFLVFAARTAAFFVGPKRREIDYAKAWVSMLLNLPANNCFETYLRLLVKSQLK